LRSAAAGGVGPAQAFSAAPGINPGRWFSRDEGTWGRRHISIRTERSTSLD